MLFEDRIEWYKDDRHGAKALNALPITGYSTAVEIRDGRLSIKTNGTELLLSEDDRTSRSNSLVEWAGAVNAQVARLRVHRRREAW